MFTLYQFCCEILSLHSTETSSPLHYSPNEACLLKKTPSVIIDLLLSICYTIQDLSQTLPGGIFMLPWLKWNPAWIVRQQLRYPHQPAQTLFVQMRVLGWKYCSVKWQNDHQAVKKKSLMATISVAEQLSTTLISYSTCNMKINSSIH